MNHAVLMRVIKRLTDLRKGLIDFLEFWQAATEAWESLQLEVGKTHVRGEDVVAQIWLSGRGRESGLDVEGIEAGHLVRFRNLKIVEFLAFPTFDLAVKELEGSPQAPAA